MLRSTLKNDYTTVSRISTTGKKYGCHYIHVFICFPTSLISGYEFELSMICYYKGWMPHHYFPSRAPHFKRSSHNLVNM